MQNNRRKFMLATGLAMGGTALGGLQLIASESPSGAAEREVSDVIARYGSTVRVTRGETTEFKVKMRGHDRFAKTFDAQRGLPFERIMVCEGNTLKFNHGGVDFAIVNVA